MNQTIRKRIEDINNGIVPEGYKQTPFGIFPCDWETDKTYGELFEFNGSLSQSREELGEEGYAYLHYGDMHRNSFNKVSYEQYSRLPKVNISLKGKEKYLMKDGDVAFLDASEDLGGTSRCVLIDNPDNEPFFAGLHTIPARETGNNFSKWYKQYITLPDFVKKQFQRLACGFKVYGLNKDTIAKIDYAFPKDKTEQGKIAEILMKWDEMVELQEQYIQKLELRKKAIMKKLLTPKDGWEKWKLVDLVESMSSGGTPSTKNTEYYGGNIVWVSIDDMSKAGKYIDTSARKITKLGLENSSAKLFPENTILYAMYASIGKTVISTIPCTTSQAILGIIVDKEKVDNQYLYYYLLNLQDKIILQGQKGTQANLNKEMVEKFDISLPKDLDEQKNISKILIRADEEISLQKEKLAKIKEQRKAMQQYLLTGIVRVS